MDVDVMLLGERVETQDGASVENPDRVRVIGRDADPGPFREGAITNIFVRRVSGLGPYIGVSHIVDGRSYAAWVSVEDAKRAIAAFEEKENEL